jgi:uncharacterized protein (DUF924 family)
MADAPQPVWQGVLDFWFLPAGAPGHGAARAEWFRKDSGFDARIRDGFGDQVEGALSGGYRDWDATPQGALARILLLDQFTRNIFRDTPRAFAGDALALQAAEALLAKADDRQLSAIERWFAYLPYMHAETVGMQARSVTLFQELHRASASFAGPLDFAIRHRDIIARFGRFPHRNAILGRVSTAEEVEFLKQPGSGF